MKTLELIQEHLQENGIPSQLSPTQDPTQGPSLLTILHPKCLEILHLWIDTPTTTINGNHYMPKINLHHPNSLQQITQYIQEFLKTDTTNPTYILTFTNNLPWNKTKNLKPRNPWLSFP